MKVGWNFRLIKLAFAGVIVSRHLGKVYDCQAFASAVDQTKECEQFRGSNRCGLQFQCKTFNTSHMRVF